MMDRRTFLTRLSILTAAAAVMDPAELIERLAPRRLYVPGADFGPVSPFGERVHATTVAELDALLKQVYSADVLRLADDDYMFAANGFDFPPQRGGSITFDVSGRVIAINKRA